MLAPAVVVCPPDWIASNPETAETNAYQQEGSAEDRALAVTQFRRFVDELETAGIQVIQLSPPPGTPDAVFPNNWFSTHGNGDLAIYPMRAVSRRQERDVAGLQRALVTAGFSPAQTLDFTDLEDENEFVEGTGSLIFDHTNRLAYACLSPRTTEFAVGTVCQALDYLPVLFRATDLDMEVYHTNVVMALGSDFAVICLEAVEDPRALIKSLEDTGKQVVEITREQMRAFCGNVIELAGPVILMSDCAYQRFRPDQLAVLNKGRQIIHPDISAIEKLGGGSARCMVAEVLLPLST